MASVNDMIVYQASTVLSSLVQQATGQKVITPSTPGEFVSVATTALKTGYDPILNALSQMWGRTIFSVRPYSRMFKGMEMDMERWGNAMRKLSIADKTIEDDARFKYPVGYDSAQTPATGDGKSIDMFALNKPDVLQTNFYGQAVYENSYTIFRDNLDTAFTSPAEFMRFTSMVAQNRSDKLEQYRENIARGLLANYAGSLLAEAQDARVIHLLTEYNTLTGLSLTAQSVYQPDNFAPFMRWVFSRVSVLSKLMRERSEMFQTVVNSKHVMRHTPADRLKVYMYTPAMEQMTAMVNSITYNDDFIKYTDFEAVNFWQSIETPDSISVNPTYTKTDGTVTTKTNTENPASAGVEQAGIFGLMFDEDALGYAQVNAWNQLTPFNAKGGYWNDFDHVNFRTIQDMTEKGLILLLD
nr:MAG TPA: major capsid protein [Bacteriophage sp.]